MSELFRRLFLYWPPHPLPESDMERVMAPAYGSGYDQAQRDPHAIQYFAQCLSLALELLTSFKTAISHFRSKLTA